MKQISLGITCIGSIIGQGIIKSIKSSSIANECEITGFEYFRDTVGSFWVDRTYIMPDILKGESFTADYIKLLKEYIKKHHIQILFIGMDFELPMMAKHRDSIFKETGCRLIVSDSTVVEIAEDKYQTYLFLKENSHWYPLTWLPDEKINVTYPAIVKPRRGERSRGLYHVSNESELDAILTHPGDQMVQECIASKHEEFTCSVLYFDNQVRTSICLRRYLKDGNTHVGYHTKNIPAKIKPYIEDTVHSLKPYGPCNLQLRVGENGIPKIFEINARFSGTTHFRVLCGLNEVEYVVRYLLNREPPDIMLKYGTILRFPEEMFVPEFS